VCGETAQELLPQRDDYQDLVRKNITISHDAFILQPPPRNQSLPRRSIVRFFVNMPQSGVDIATTTANALIVVTVLGERIRRFRDRHMKSDER
jgi:hypothetical protein